MTKRTIIFHIGQPKTGSSALQAFLSQNVMLLEKSGVSYPFPEGEKTVASGYCSGNLMHTMQRIAKSKETGAAGTPLQSKELLERYLSEAIQLGLKGSKSPTVLFSSEAFTTPLSRYSLPVFKELSNDETRLSTSTSVATKPPLPNRHRGSYGSRDE